LDYESEDGAAYGLSWEDLEDLENQGKLNAAGLNEHG
jgi:hypothetical protein